MLLEGLANTVPQKSLIEMARCDGEHIDRHILPKF